MKIKIPKTLMGQPIEGSLERVLARKPSAHTTSNTPQDTITPITTQANIDKSQYIAVPQYNALIRKREEHKGLQWEPTIRKLAENGLFMPTPVLFMTHFMNVKNAAEGSYTLVDANGDSLSQGESQDLWNYMSSTNRALSNGEVCWTWLDAKFITSGGKLLMRTNHRVDHSNGTLDYRDDDPGNYLTDNCYVNLNFSTKGLPTAKSSKQDDYVQGQNIYYWKPVADRVAGFYANSGRAGLGCNWNPLGSNPRLGVFSCAEGAVARKN